MNDQNSKFSDTPQMGQVKVSGRNVVTPFVGKTSMPENHETGQAKAPGSETCPLPASAWRGPRESPGKRCLSCLKSILTRIGALLPMRGHHQLQMVLNYMRLGRWMRDNQFLPRHRCPNRSAVFDIIAERLRDERVLYLEFGVHEGASMRHWSHVLRNPESRLHGFDSFEGLPEDFDIPGGRYEKGHFDVGGQLPVIDDSRVTFIKGWFENVLPTYTLPPHDQLVITLDADLYSSTALVLKELAPHIKIGTVLYFDDMSRPEHEPKAFREFMDETGLGFSVVAVDGTLNKAAFVCNGRVGACHDAARPAEHSRDAA